MPNIYIKWIVFFVLLYRMEDLANAATSKPDSKQEVISRSQETAASSIFMCSLCSLKEHYDYKGTRPPFAQQFVYSEECYVMKDPFSLPNRGEVLILGANCDICYRSVCIGCSIFYTKRFCLKCASSNMQSLPPQLCNKIRNLMKHADF